MKQALRKVVAALILWPITAIGLMGPFATIEQLSDPWLFFLYCMLPVLGLVILIALMLWALNQLTK